MKIVAFILTLTCIAGISRFSVNGLPSQKRQYAGDILEIHGKACFIKDANSQETRLHPKNDLGRKLYAGESLKCESDCSLRVKLYGNTFPIVAKMGWYPIPEVSPDNGDDSGRGGRAGAKAGGGEGRGIYSNRNKQDAKRRRRP
jgi:hypothetical protein